jgi:hypothetical protein
MPIYVVIRQASTDTNALRAALQKAYPEDLYALSDDAWLVSDSTTAVDVSNKIGITGPKTEGLSPAPLSAMVLETASYYGRANPAIWSWIKAKWEGGPNG